MGPAEAVCDRLRISQSHFAWRRGMHTLCTAGSGHTPRTEVCSVRTGLRLSSRTAQQQVRHLASHIPAAAHLLRPEAGSPRLLVRLAPCERCRTHAQPRAAQSARHTLHLLHQLCATDAAHRRRVLVRIAEILYACMQARCVVCAWQEAAAASADTARGVNARRVAKVQW